jgi:hypothetical protein
MGVDETRPPNTEVLNTEVLQVQAQVEGWVATRVGATTSLTHSHTAAMAQGTGTPSLQPARPPSKRNSRHPAR